MNQRQLGKNGPWLTEIGFGAWAIGGSWEYGWGPANDADSIRAIQFGLELGINWIDTAPAYGWGHSESVVGEALTGRRASVFVATKCGLLPGEGPRLQRNLHPRSIQQELDASLKRLKTDYVDLYQFHWPDKAHPVEKAWESLVQLKAQGKIRWLGVSNFDVPLLERCQKIHPVDSLQPPYSLLRREIEMEILPYCQMHGIGVIAYSPMQSGLLTGTFDPNRLAPDDWRRQSPWFTEPKLGQAMQFVAELQPLAKQYGKTVGQLAIAWVLQQPGITAAIVGARSVEQVAKNSQGSGWQISAADIEKINSLLRASGL